MPFFWLDTPIMAAPLLNVLGVVRTLWSFIFCVCVPDSEASTVPATQAEVKASIKQVQKMRANNTTKDPAPEVVSPRPQLKREVQSKEILTEKPSKSLKVPPTAAKAKVQPPQPAPKPAPQPPVKAENASPATARAVAQCLARKSTSELTSTPSQTSSAKPGKKAGFDPSPPAESEHDDDEDDDAESMNSEEYRELERKERAKREAKNRYMRFSRSLKSTLTHEISLATI